MPFLLERKWTLPQKTDEGRKKSIKPLKVQDKILSFWSIPQLEKEADEEMESSTQVVKGPSLKSMTNQDSDCIEDGELQKKIEENYFTLNLLDRNELTLPNIKAISKAQKMLMSKDEFTNYQKTNSHEGMYLSALSQIERKEKSYLHRLNLSSKAHIKTRKNIFEIQSESKVESISGSFSASNYSRKRISLMRPLQAINKKFYKTLYPPKLHKGNSSESDKWKLRDFLDPIILNLQTNEQKMLNLNQRSKFLSQLKQIDNDCERIEVDASTNKYLNIFAKFSSAIQSKLGKKHRKLEKVQKVFKK